VIEAPDAKGEFFGFDRFREIVSTAAIGGPDRVPPATLESVQRFRASEPTDDVLIVAMWRPTNMQ
jgi:serine phosphatase RsbU (regulator of sigma subunit)